MTANKNPHPDLDRLQAYLDRALEIPDARELEEHLAACGRCRAELARLEAVAARLENLPELSLGRDLSPAILARLEAKAAVSPGLVITLVLEALAAGGAIAVLIPAIKSIAWPLLTQDLGQRVLAGINLLVTQLFSSWTFWWAQLSFSITAFLKWQGVQGLLPSGAPEPWILVLAAAALGLLVNYLAAATRLLENNHHNSDLN